MDLRLTRQPLAALATRAYAGAARRLESPGCRRLIRRLRDRSGRPLQEGLDRLQKDPSSYLGLVVFASGEEHGRCASPSVLAMTRMNVRIVWLCPKQFEWMAARQPDVAEAVLVHEALHTLGLGENPPASSEITRTVLRECRR
jgi:hypothetical protein